jgi:ATP-binding cassette subfamily F protein uup
LLLDEPTNHLDLPAIEWLERELAGMGSGIVVISHDRRLLERLSRRTVWLDRGVTRVLDDGFAAFEPWRDAIIAREESEQHKLGRKIAMEEDWLRYGVTARRTRNQRRLAELHALRRKRREYRGAAGVAQLDAAQSELSGRLVAVARGIAKSYGGRAVVRGFSTRIMRGDRVGIVGPNGAGKTTLLRMLTGALAPDVGEVGLGTNLAQVTLDQRRETLDPQASLADALTGGSGDSVTVACSAPSRPAPRSASCRAASAPGLRWRAPSLAPPTSWCSTSRPTISTSRPSICCRSGSPNIREPCCWSATTATSSTAS